MENILNNFPIISEYKFINSFYTLITYPVESKFRNENLRTEIIIEKEIQEYYYNFTLEVYNSTILQQIKEKKRHFLGLLVASATTGIYFNDVANFTNITDYVLFLLKINWITFLPSFIFYNLGVYYLFKDNSSLIDINKIINNKDKLKNIKIIFQITSLGFNIESIKASLNSVDMDVFDPSVAPGVGTPEPYGINFKDFLNIIKNVLDKRIEGFDIVETSPLFDNGISSVLAAKIIFECVSFLYKKSKTKG